jgi:hypothetical protein
MIDLPALRHFFSLKKLANGWTPGSTAAQFRQKRLVLLSQLLAHLPEPVRILDVGGQDPFWHALDTSILPKLQITFLNIFPFTTDLPNAVSLVGDARCMKEFPDGHFDLAFSNSVIEHVGGLREQKSMARECQRVAGLYFVQTPNRYFPLEPHFLFLGFQFLPQTWRARLHCCWNLGWWKRAATYYEALEEVESIRLMTHGELDYLFPNGTIWEEKFYGLTKSYVAYGAGTATRHSETDA